MAKGGIRAVSVVRGDRVAKLQALAWAILLVPVSLLPSLIGVTGLFYGACALLISMIFLGWTCGGLWSAKPAPWARSLFFASLIYLPALIAAMVIDVCI
jgi:protoheme IX farnesyltransferase